MAYHWRHCFVDLCRFHNLFVSKHSSRRGWTCSYNFCGGREIERLFGFCCGLWVVVCFVWWRSEVLGLLEGFRFRNTLGLRAVRLEARERERKKRRGGFFSLLFCDFSKPETVVEESWIRGSGMRFRIQDETWLFIVKKRFQWFSICWKHWTKWVFLLVAHFEARKSLQVLLI